MKVVKLEGLHAHVRYELPAEYAGYELHSDIRMRDAHRLGVSILTGDDLILPGTGPVRVGEAIYTDEVAGGTFTRDDTFYTTPERRFLHFQFTVGRDGGHALIGSGIGITRMIWEEEPEGGPEAA